MTRKTFSNGYLMPFVSIPFLSQTYWGRVWASRNVLATDISQLPQLCRFAFLGLKTFPWDPLFLNQHVDSLRSRELKKCLLCLRVSIDLSDTAAWKKDDS